LRRTEARIKQTWVSKWLGNKKTVLDCVDKGESWLKSHAHRCPRVIWRQKQVSTLRNTSHKLPRIFLQAFHSFWTS
jgi:hypothetical protein